MATLQTKVSFGSATFNVALAQTQQELTTGLQGVASLPSNEGLLFVFNTPHQTTFHMGSVSFPIDIVFLRKEQNEYRVAKVVHNAQPGTKERWSCYADLVLELVGGTCESLGIENNQPCFVEEAEMRKASLKKKAMEGDISDPEFLYDYARIEAESQLHGTNAEDWMDDFDFLEDLANNPELQAASDKADTALDAFIDKHVMGFMNDENAELPDANYLLWMTALGHGITFMDGDWDHLITPEDQKHIYEMLNGDRGIQKAVDAWEAAWSNAIVDVLMERGVKDIKEI